MKKILFFFISLAIISCAKKESAPIEPYEPNIIPQPVSYENVDETFVVTNNINLELETDNEQVQNYVTAFTEFLSNAGVSTNVNAADNSIHILLMPIL